MISQPDHIKLSIPNPCSEKWDEMKREKCGRFCQVCSKTVIDFSQLSDEELVTIISQYKEDLCGFFRPDQLERPIYLPVKPTFFKRFLSGKLAALFLLFQMFVTDIRAQKKSTHATQQLSEPNTTEITIKGVLFDFETQKPISNRKVYFNNAASAKLNLTVTGANGKFSFKIPIAQFEGAFLSFDQIDYEHFIPEEKLTASGSNSIHLQLYQYLVQTTPTTIVKYTRPIMPCNGVNGTVTIETISRPPTFIEKIKHCFSKKNANRK